MHLLGFPGVGKSTNVVLGVIESDGVRAVPPGVWERVAEIREVQYRSIAELSPPDWSFVFTNVLVESDPMSPVVVARLVELASSRSTSYVPVMLACNPIELRRRVSSPDRVGRHKWIDSDAVEAFAAGETLFRPTSLEIEVDVTELSADASAQKVSEHLEPVSAAGR